MAAAVTWLAPYGGDYAFDAAPAVDAVLRGDLDRFLSAQHLMGTFAVLVRVPWVALASAFDGGELLAYRVGALPCVVAAGLLGFYVRSLMARHHASGLAQVGVIVLCVLNPLTLSALRFGHPEEMLGAALCVGAVIAARERHAGGAGLLLGLALATKQWALLAVLPVLLAAPDRRLRIALISGSIAMALTLPLAIADRGAFVETHTRMVVTSTNLGPYSVWWPLETHRERTFSDGAQLVSVTRSSLPDWMSPIPHLLIVLAAVPLAFLYWRRRGWLRADDALGLLALLFLLRCVLDPVNNTYYHVPFVIALAAYEALRHRRAPIVATLASILAWQTTGDMFAVHQTAAANAIYLAWTLPLVAYLALELYLPQTIATLRSRAGRLVPRSRRSPLRSELSRRAT